MKILHTSDWHLGHTLHTHSREFEHKSFLDWLLQIIALEAVDALIISGDIFDSANPPASAQSLWYGFMAEARRKFADLDVVVIGGNHDSAARLDAPGPLFRAFGVRVVGCCPFGRDGSTDWERVIVPLHNGAGEICAWVAAVPFLRPADLPPVADNGVDPLVQGVRLAYAAILNEVRSRRGKREAIIATGHCYMTGGLLSELSERKILGGNQHALPADIFPDDIAYVALGHLHYPQSVGGRDHVRYCGTPIPLSMAEADYQSQVCLVELKEDKCTDIKDIRVPRAVEMLRIPHHGTLSLEELIGRLKSLPLLQESNDETRPFLEVCIALEHPEPGLRRQVNEALSQKNARLVKITSSYGGSGSPLAGATIGKGLHELTPEEVFVRRYTSFCGNSPPDDIMAAFHELLDQVEQGEAPS